MITFYLEFCHGESMLSPESFLIAQFEGNEFCLMVYAAACA